MREQSTNPKCVSLLKRIQVFLSSICALVILILFFEGPVFALSPTPQFRLSPLALSLKFVEFTDDRGDPIVDRLSLQAILHVLNRIYSPCQLVFLLGRYEVVKPERVGLTAAPQSLTEMRRFRQPFMDARHLVIIHTAGWDHQRVGPANAWTAMPGDFPLGAVIEGKVARFAGIIAHELGHYLSLYHVKDDFNLMNPVIYAKSNQLSEAQCHDVRRAALSYHSHALRKGLL